MRKLIAASAFALSAISAAVPVWANPVYLGPHNDLYVMNGGQRMPFHNIDFKATTVCAFKAQVAQVLYLRMNKFDLVWDNTLLDPARTLGGIYMQNGAVLAVKAVDDSRQCT